LTDPRKNGANTRPGDCLSATSRTAAREKYRWSHIKPLLEERGVQLLSAGIDENPFAYKDIHEVMNQQQDLLDILARFDPKIVRLAEGGEKPED
jgi:tRNA-splicing ligase RtcB